MPVRREERDPQTTRAALDAASSPRSLRPQDPENLPPLHVEGAPPQLSPPAAGVLARIVRRAIVLLSDEGRETRVA
jgi:hypothetical protein